MSKFLRFFSLFAGGSFLTNMLVTEYPLMGSFIIGAILGILGMEHEESAEMTNKEKKK